MCKLFIVFCMIRRKIMAESKRYYWLKLKDNYFTSPKIRKLRKIAGGDTLTIIYLKIQLLTVKSEGKYEYQHIENSLAEELALILDEDVDNVKLTLGYLQAQDLIYFDEQSNELHLYEAMANIGSECESAERVRLCRERKDEREKLLQCNGSVTEVKRISNSISISKSSSNDFDIQKMIDTYNFTIIIKDKVLEWLKYKKEKNQKYKETGLKNLLNRVKKDFEQYGEEYVVAEFENSMTQNYSGLYASKDNKQKSTTTDTSTPSKYDDFGTIV